MIEGLDQALHATGEPGLPELRRALGTVLAGSASSLRFADEQRLKARVFRLRFNAGQHSQSVVVKRLDPIEAKRNELAAMEWLPAVRLAANGPGLLGASATTDGPWIWHVYQDLGDATLEGREGDAGRVAAAVRLIARIHSRFASHPRIAECRPYGTFGISYFASNVRGALRGLESLRPPTITLSRSREALRDRLLAQLEMLLESVPRRARCLAEWGGPETLLHGDLWTSNTFVLGTPSDFEPRLIDWDRAGVGPMSYDLSTFLLRFSPAQRPWILDLYARSLENQAWRLPSTPHLNLLFETAELARYANCLIWPALAIANQGAGWGFAALAEVEQWFGTLEPVLAVEPTVCAEARRAAVGARSCDWR